MTVLRTLIALASGLCAASMSPAFAEDLRLTASYWPPYVDTNVQRNGFAVALVSLALERAGYGTSATIEPWPEALEATQDGEYDVICGIWYREDRGEMLTFSEPYIDNEISLVKRASSDLRFTERDDLVGLRIGVVGDYAYTAQGYDTTGIDVQVGGSVRENLERLRAGDVDLVLGDRRVLLAEINERAHAKSFDVLPNHLLSRGLRIAVSKQRQDHAEIVAAFEDAIADMKADGSFNAILATFRISTW